MRHTIVPALALALTAVVLAGCAGLQERETVYQVALIARRVTAPIIELCTVWEFVHNPILESTAIFENPFHLTFQHGRENRVCSLPQAEHIHRGEEIVGVTYTAAAIQVLLKGVAPIFLNRPTIGPGRSARLGL